MSVPLNLLRLDTVCINLSKIHSPQSSDEEDLCAKRKDFWAL